jgi:phosphate transport system substrate-binding protein
MGFSGLKKFFPAMLITIASLSFPFYLTLAAPGQVLTIGGVGSSLGTMKVLARAFESVNPGIRVRVLPSLGSTGGISAVAHGAIDLGLSGRPLREEEAKKGIEAKPFARTPFIFVTKKANVTGLTARELIDIYEGRSLTWPDGTRIRLVMRPAGDTDTAIIRGISDEMDRAVNTALGRDGMIMAVTNQESDETVEKTPGSLGASTLAQAVSEKRSYAVLSFNGVEPSPGNLSNKTYPISKTFYFVTSPETSALAHQFISFVRSLTGISILEKNGNLYINPSRS